MRNQQEKCPVATAISVFGTRWKIQILRDLIKSEENKLRFSDFKETIEGISDKMLSQSLKELERDHLIERKLIDASPPRTEYSLTDMGKNLSTVLYSLYDWGTLYQQKYIFGEECRL